MRYCKTCRHARVRGKGEEWLQYARCVRPNSSYDPVAGTSGYCEFERQPPDDYRRKDVCGPDGKYWEPIPPRRTFWQRIFGAAE